MRRLHPGCIVAATLLLAATASADSPAKAEIGRVLVTLHQRASEADFEGYFDLYHERAVFLGTDRDEYWPLPAFKRYTRARFETGTGWTYHPVERFVHVAGDTAWFEERLRHDRYGETRGTGVLLRTRDGWKVTQYNLTLPIPNELFRDVAADIAEHYDENVAP